MPATEGAGNSAKSSYQFGDFLIDVCTFRICKGNDIRTLPPRAFDVLVYLIVNRQRVVEKQELFDCVWQGTHVTDNALTREIKEIRRALGDDAAAPRYIETVRKRGYRFIAEVKAFDEDRSSKVSQDVSRDEISLEEGKPEKLRTEGHDSPPAELRRDAITTQVTYIPAKVVAILGAGMIVLIAIAFAVLKGRSPVLPVQGDDFDRLLNAYNLRHEVLTQNCYLQTGFVIIGLSLIGFFRTNKPRISALGIAVSPGWLHFVVALVLFYLWIEFGFALDDLIKYRAEAWQYLSSIGDPIHDHDISRRAMLFNDAGFIDGWFMCFRPGQHVISTNFFFGTAFFFTIIFGTLFALTHAYAVIGLRVGAEYFSPKTKEPFSRLALLVRFLPWFSLTLLIFSHLQFRFGGKHPNWMQPLIGVAALIFGFLLSRATRVGNQAHPEERKKHRFEWH